MPTRWRGSLLLRLSVGALLAGVLATASTSWLLVRDAEIDTEARGRQVLLQDATRSADSLTQRIVERQRSLWAVAEEMKQSGEWAGHGGGDPALRVMFDALLQADRAGQVTYREGPSELSRSWTSRRFAPGFKSTVREGRPMVWLVQPHSDADHDSGPACRGRARRADHGGDADPAGDPPG
ncbi:hypothetical protein [Ideonella sp. B508-1]|uniref:hypothetical protein n=1 Tax=Ideonella sp. B508-1 TaxID=137716 RepID=UPI000349BC5D|nr:hypothetical protein [Ideonella sp. B508-1]